MRNISKHIIHCSDSTFGDAKIIRLWHKMRGFKDIGYHFIIREDGEIEVGRMMNEVGAHCKGHNMDSIGTCLIGKGEADFTDMQKTSLKKLHKMLQDMFPDIRAFEHRFFNVHKTCPNACVKEMLEGK